MAAYDFTSKPISLALLDASKHGIDVKIVVDKSNATSRYTAATFLANQGVPVRIDYKYAIMHDKFIVVDGEIVETGSFNFTSFLVKATSTFNIDVTSVRPLGLPGDRFVVGVVGGSLGAASWTSESETHGPPAVCRRRRVRVAAEAAGPARAANTVAAVADATSCRKFA